jgi:hypothetical protein
MSKLSSRKPIAIIAKLAFALTMILNSTGAI